MPQKIKLFYQNYDDNQEIDQESPIECGLDETMDYMEKLPDTDGNFLGLVLPDSCVVQFMHNEDQSICLDIPAEKKGGAYRKEIDMDECIQIIKDIYEGKDPKAIKGLIFDSF
jgi:hypothetical protein